MLIPKHFLESVIAIELIPEQDGGNYQCIATGFLCGFISGQEKSDGNALYSIFLVTNRHVLSNKKIISLRFNSVGGNSKRYPLNLIDTNGNNIWLSHPNDKVDLGMIAINANLLVEEGIDFKFIPEEQMAFQDTVKNEEITLGDNIYALGYPMGVAGNLKNYAIARGGVIARLDDEIIQNEHVFLIDASIFPGNSGGPVILKPELVSLEGTKATATSYLLGVVAGYLTYSETAYSLQTDVPTPRVEFRENSGLGSVVPIDYVKEIFSMSLTNQEEQDDTGNLVTDEKALKSE